MKIRDLIYRPDIFSICETGAKIPWNDPEFSKRMLKNHLSQEHDWASRQYNVILQHTDWIASLLCDKDARILDLGCGPGLYTHLLAQNGYECVGVDFAPASIEYAENRAQGCGLNLEYVLADVRDYEPQGLFDLVMMIFGELNEFSRADAHALLVKAAKCLKPNGRLLLEIQTPAAVKGQGEDLPEWKSLDDDYLATGPYLCLTEYAWDEELQRAATRWIVVGEDGATQMFASCTQSYDKSAFRQLLAEAGFKLEAHVSVEDWPAGESFEGQLATCLCRGL